MGLNLVVLSVRLGLSSGGFPQVRLASFPLVQQPCYNVSPLENYPSPPSPLSRAVRLAAGSVRAVLGGNCLLYEVPWPFAPWPACSLTAQVPLGPCAPRRYMTLASRACLGNQKEKVWPRRLSRQVKDRSDTPLGQLPAKTKEVLYVTNGYGFGVTSSGSSRFWPGPG